MIIKSGVLGLAGVILSEPFGHLIITLLAIMVVICVIIIYFSTKLKKVNGDLLERNRQISDINTELLKSNKELAIHKELATKKAFESDRFYEMLVQSANDGISFYDREWRLKYANTCLLYT